MGSPPALAQLPAGQRRKPRVRPQGAPGGGRPGPGLRRRLGGAQRTCLRTDRLSQQPPGAAEPAGPLAKAQGGPDPRGPEGVAGDTRGHQGQVPLFSKRARVQPHRAVAFRTAAPGAREGASQAGPGRTASKGSWVGNLRPGGRPEPVHPHPNPEGPGEPESCASRGSRCAMRSARGVRPGPVPPGGQWLLGRSLSYRVLWAGSVPGEAAAPGSTGAPRPRPTPPLSVPETEPGGETPRWAGS